MEEASASNNGCHILLDAEPILNENRSHLKRISDFSSLAKWQIPK